MDPHDLSALAGNLARHIGMQPPPVVVGDIGQSGQYASFVKRQGVWMLRIDPRAAALPGPVADGYLAHPLVAASLEQHLRMLRRVRAVSLLGAIATVGLMLIGVTLGWALVATIPAVSVLVVVVQMLTLRQSMLQADQRVAEVFGPGFLLPALEFMQDHPPQVRGLARLLMRTIPTPAQRRARLDSRSGWSTPH